MCSRIKRYQVSCSFSLSIFFSRSINPNNQLCVKRASSDKNGSTADRLMLITFLNEGIKLNSKLFLSKK